VVLDKDEHLIKIELIHMWGEQDMTAVRGCALIASVATLSLAVFDASALAESSTVANPGAANGLTGVACQSSNGCRAVGESTFAGNGGNSVSLNEALSWDGSTWLSASVPTPNVGVGVIGAELSGVTCPTSNRCWAFGESQGASPDNSYNEILSWSRTGWSTVPTPQPGALLPPGFYAGPSLAGAACVTQELCWAVGSYVDNAGTLANEALMWNGKNWRLVRTPDPDGVSSVSDNSLNQVACPGPRSCWAVGALSGRSELLHWNGSRWTNQTLPEPLNTPAATNELNGVACASPDDCWALGDWGRGNKGQELSQAIHWNGKTWSLAGLPDPGGRSPSSVNHVDAVTCLSASDCWAVGSYGLSGSQPSLNQVLHWDGLTWQVIAVPNPRFANHLAGIACASTDDCWAVGEDAWLNQNSQNEILHWDGNAWSRLTDSPSGS